MGFRPLSLYGLGRDFGLTADPTLAMKAAVFGRKFQIRWGGATDLVYTADVARALLAATASRLDDARDQADLGPAPATALDAGIRQTLDEFARLEKDGRLDSRELT
jgi:nucleoside-diphosphate-sugar epimerase